MFEGVTASELFQIGASQTSWFFKRQRITNKLYYCSLHHKIFLLSVSFLSNIDILKFFVTWPGESLNVNSFLYTCLGLVLQTPQCTMPTVC